jgi:dTDP-4-dehydrorhamnose 3,5-epimerase-like enzyme
MNDASVYSCTLLQLPKINATSGNITAVNNSEEIPFDVKRIFYLYDIPGGVSRGGHAHKELQQIIIAASGSFDLIVDDGRIKQTFHLSRSYLGVYMPAGIWGELSNFSSGAISLVLASDVYNESDYLRDYDDYVNWKLNR